MDGLVVVEQEIKQTGIANKILGPSFADGSAEAELVILLVLMVDNLLGTGIAGCS